MCSILNDFEIGIRQIAWHTASAGEHLIFQKYTRARGSSPETLSLGWLPAVRFIPSERVSGELPPTVDLRSPFFK
jgi:hypothetical protein